MKYMLAELGRTDECVAGNANNEGLDFPLSTIKAALNGSDTDSTTAKLEAAHAEEPSEIKSGKIETADIGEADFSQDNDFQTSKKRFRTPTGPARSAKRMRPETDGLDDTETEIATPIERPAWRIETGKNDASEINSKSCAEGFCEKEGKTEGKSIENLDDSYQMPRTEVTRMTILSSREHSCIHPDVSESRHKGEECRRHVKGLDHACVGAIERLFHGFSGGPTLTSVEQDELHGCNKEPLLGLFMLDFKLLLMSLGFVQGTSCNFFGNASSLCRPSSMKKYNLNVAWDIEDLVTVGKKANACPYYAARDLMDEADIIFCPYNYLIDPLIRSQMGINLKDEILVLDEAHNIEDSAREAASITVTSIQLENVMEELDKLIVLDVMAVEHRAMRLLCTKLSEWLESMSDCMQKTGFEQATRILPFNDMIARMQLIDITTESFHYYRHALLDIIASDQDADGVTDIDAPKLSSNGMLVLKSIHSGLEVVFDTENNFCEDYKIVVTKKGGMGRRQNRNMSGGWRIAQRDDESRMWIFSLNFWCMNPAVVFSPIGQSTRCIILTSGTLSPMTSFASELGVKFPIHLEANHVIDESQVWVGALTVGTDNKSIVANYQTSETFPFQDEVGNVLLEVCKVIPRGVLCFFPSYAMLDKLKRRWESTDLWRKLHEVKRVFSEPRGSDRGDLTAEDHTGGLLLAVCRGKVSEGLDFTDDNARAVLTVGIPFPDFRDTQIDLKKKYNNEHCKSRGLLTGSDWYEIQAYRALNQALGRCIRHRKDWGAIILLDQRFGRGDKYKKGLSKWVRGKCRIFTEFNRCKASLKFFAEVRQGHSPQQQSQEMPMNASSDKLCDADGSTCCTDNVDVNKVGVRVLDVKALVGGTTESGLKKKVPSRDRGARALGVQFIDPPATAVQQNPAEPKSVGLGEKEQQRHNGQENIPHSGNKVHQSEDVKEECLQKVTEEAIIKNPMPAAIIKNKGHDQKTGFEDVNNDLAASQSRAFFSRSSPIMVEGMPKIADRRHAFYQNRSKLFKSSDKQPIDNTAGSRKRSDKEERKVSNEIIVLIDDDDDDEVAVSSAMTSNTGTASTTVAQSKLSDHGASSRTPELFSEEANEIDYLKDDFWSNACDKKVTNGRNGNKTPVTKASQNETFKRMSPENENLEISEKKVHDAKSASRPKRGSAAGDASATTSFEDDFPTPCSRSKRRNSNLRMASKIETDVCKSDYSPQKTAACSKCKTELIANGTIFQKMIQSALLARFLNFNVHYRFFVFEIDLRLNSIYSKDDGALYIPLCCKSCYKNHRRSEVIGFQMLQVSKPTEEKVDSNEEDRVFLFPNAVSIR
eukprot:gene15838-7165_t